MRKASKLALYPQAAEDLRAIYEPLYSEILERLRMLREFPELGGVMSKEYSGWRSIPVGVFRIVYRITLRAVEVLYIRHCKRRLPAPPSES